MARLDQIFEMYRKVIDNYGHIFIKKDSSNEPVAVFACCRLKLLSQVDPKLFNQLIEFEAHLEEGDKSSSRNRHLVEKAIHKLLRKDDFVCFGLFYITLRGRFHKEVFSESKEVYSDCKRVLGVNSRSEASFFEKNGFKSRPITPDFYIVE